MTKSQQGIIVAHTKGYTIDKDGNVFYNNKKRKLNNNNNYLRFSIRHNKIHYEIKVHRFQAYQKFGNKIFESGIEVRHLNGNSLDNSYENIDIGTHQDNMLDTPQEIRIKNAKYASSFMQKYNHKEIYDYYMTCQSYKKTMNHFKIPSKNTIHFIIKKYNIQNTK